MASLREEVRNLSSLVGQLLQDGEARPLGPHQTTASSSSSPSRLTTEGGKDCSTYKADDPNARSGVYSVAIPGYGVKVAR